MAFGSSGGQSENLGLAMRGQAKHRDEQYGAMERRAALPGFMQGLSGFGGGQGFDAFGPGHDSRWDGFFQGVEEAGGGKPVKMAAPRGTGGGMQLGRTYDPRTQGSAVDGLEAPGGGGVSFGADAEMARRVKALQLAGLTAQEDQARMAGEGQGMQQQRRNIAQHGTIETQPDFQRRTGQENAADLLDEGTPQGRLRSLTTADKLRQSTEAAKIAAGSRLGVADLNAGASRYGADQRLAGTEEQAAASREEALTRAFASILGSRYAGDPDVERARRGMADVQGDDVEPEPSAPPVPWWKQLLGRQTEPR